MSTSWNAWYTKCPFFKTDDGRSMITCEGVGNSCNLSLRYMDKHDYELQLEVFCKNHFQNCEVYRMILEKYEE